MCLTNMQLTVVVCCLIFTETFGSFLLRHLITETFWSSLTFVLKLAVTVFLAYIFKHSD